MLANDELESEQIIALNDHVSSMCCSADIIAIILPTYTIPIALHFSFSLF